MSRKRKAGSGEVLKIGNKTISLEGYLTKKPKTNSTPSTSHPNTPTPTTENDSSTTDFKEFKPSRPLTGDSSLFPTRRALPLYLYQDRIRSILSKKDVLVLVGETGSGKSTQVPQFLYQERWCQRRRVKVKTKVVDKDGSEIMEEGGKPKTREETVNVGGVIAITQPRRVAATTLAGRVAKECGTPLDTSGNGGRGYKGRGPKGKDVKGPKSGKDGEEWDEEKDVVEEMGKNGRDDEVIEENGNDRKDKKDQEKGLVGYSVRFDHRVPPGTKIKYVTEGMLLQELLRDPHLRQYSAIIVDEIHERSVDVDLLSGFLKQIVTGDKAGRGGIPLKVVVMSATAQVERIKKFFSSDDSLKNGTSGEEVEYLQIEGRQFPVEVIHEPKPVPDIQEALIKTVFKIHTQEPLSDKHGKKDILCFLTGQEEIEAAQRLVEEFAETLDPKVPKVKVFPLFGQLSMEAQHEAFQPIKHPFTRKIVLATNIAETSVTVPGVRYVIDCGKAKVKQYRPRLGMESLLAKPISKSSAIQRTGRAGREGPGKCFRLYTAETFSTLQKTDLPEILRTDVLGAILTMKARGIDDVLAFPLMDRPEIEAVENALVHLHVLGALDDEGRITEMGRKMVMFPVTAPYARVLLAAADQKYDCLLEVIDIISCITAGDDIFMQVRSEEDKESVDVYRKELQRREGDLITYLNTMQRFVSTPSSDRATFCKQRRINVRNMRQALNIRKQLRSLSVKTKMLEDAPLPDSEVTYQPVSPETAERILKAFLRGFAMKTAVLAPDSSYVTAHGKHVVAIHPSSSMHGVKREAIMFLEHVYTQKNYAKKISAIQAGWIAEALAC
ncbi:P-loop containing nucleoside triphosphate hydrolase protein [Sordaria sp. MPI-SDFR-AT-0083]|nr:P-loop containing nucleoside triphosphate hydrolase protein [Sordaria sp. MPI-SDFR-AT-0083]